MEAYEVLGFFSFPDNPDVDYAGILNFDPIKGGFLKIIHGCVVDLDIIDEKERVMRANKEYDQFDNNHKIILGVAKNTEFTLLNCESRYADINGVTQFKIDYILKDNHYDVADEIKFDKVSLYMPLLEFWVEKDIITKTGSEYHKGKNGFGFNVKPKETLSAKISKNLTIKFCVSANYSLVTNEYGKINKKPYFLLNYSEKVSLFDIEKDLYCLQDFISFATMKPIYIDMICSRNDEGFDEREIHFKRKHTTKDLKKQPLSMLFSFEYIEIDFEKTLQNWFLNYRELKHIFEMFFITTYSKQAPSFEFLSLVQALDSYSGIYAKKKEISFENKILLIIKSFRFIDVIDTKNVFVKAIVKTRNALSHGDSEEERAKEPFCYDNKKDLGWLFYGVKMLLTAVFFKNMGFEDEKIVECLKQFYIYRKILEGEYKFEEKGIEKKV